MKKVADYLTAAELALFAGQDRRARRKLTPEQTAALVRLAEGGYSYNTIANALGVHRNTVGKVVDRARGRPDGRTNNRPAVETTQREIARLISEGKSDIEIANALGVHRSTVFRYRHPRKNGHVTKWPTGVPIPAAVVADRGGPPPAETPVIAPEAREDPAFGRARLAQALARLRAIRERAQANLNGASCPNPCRTAPPPLRVRASLPITEAGKVATELEHRGWRAEAVSMGDSTAIVEVRNLAVRGHPLVATLRTLHEAREFLATCGRGLTEQAPGLGRGAPKRRETDSYLFATPTTWPPRASLGSTVRTDPYPDY